MILKKNIFGDFCSFLVPESLNLPDCSLYVFYILPFLDLSSFDLSSRHHAQDCWDMLGRFFQIGSAHPTLGGNFWHQKDISQVVDPCSLQVCFTWRFHGSRCLTPMPSSARFETEQHIAQGSHNLCNQDQGIAHQNFSNYEY